MKEIKAIIQSFMLPFVCDALEGIPELPGVTISQVAGFGRTRGAGAPEVHAEAGRDFAKKTKVEVVVPDALADRVVEAITKAARTGKPGDGKIFVIEVAQVVRIRTGERGEDAL